MYSETHSYIAEGGCPKTDTPAGQKVAVIVLRGRGFKLSYAELTTAEPLIGYINRMDGNGARSGMAYRTHGVLELRASASALGSIAHLNNPVLFDWNKDGQIYEGWVLERDPADGRLQQVVQMWWIRNLEALTEKPEIKPFQLLHGQRAK
ncbi:MULTISPECIES: hypothetical protein [unclassified Duganella]|uniref:hypothetical protein n=1 Tax=unclassified Duganella TaxID=2636909 RepID=UPI000B7F7E5F|nr:MULTISPECIES: hypothetical protein [unclassified Duganella]